jgi:hypothetical protein
MRSFPSLKGMQTLQPQCFNGGNYGPCTTALASSITRYGLNSDHYWMRNPWGRRLSELDIRQRAEVMKGLGGESHSIVKY